MKSVDNFFDKHRSHASDPEEQCMQQGVQTIEPFVFLIHHGPSPPRHSRDIAQAVIAMR